MEPKCVVFDGVKMWSSKKNVEHSSLYMSTAGMLWGAGSMRGSHCFKPSIMLWAVPHRKHAGHW